MWKKLLEWFRAKSLQKGGGLDIEKTELENKDERNFVLGGSWDYKPKQTRVLLPTLGIKDQKSVNSCVVTSIALQKEPDEGVELADDVLAAYLRSKGLMNERGTSLDAAQKALLDVGIPEKRFGDQNRANFNVFSRLGLLTEEALKNAAEHKNKSYWRANTLGAVLEQLDNGRIGQTGCIWYSGYNELYGKAILEPFTGIKLFGHAIDIAGYDMDYYGEKVVIFPNTFGEKYGNKGYFYVRFRDFEKVFVFGTRFNLDIDKDKASWMSLNNGKGIREFNGNKVYLMEGDRKRYIVDELIMWMAGISPEKLIYDTDNMLPEIPEGNEFTISDIPPYKLLEFKRLLQFSLDKPIMKMIRDKYFPEIV